MKKSLIVGAILVACSAFAAPVLEYDFSTGKMFPAKPVLVGNPEIKDGALVLDAEKKQYLELPKELDLSAARDVTFYTVLRFGEDGSMKKDASGKNTEWQGTYSALFFRESSFIMGMSRQNLYLGLHGNLWVNQREIHQNPSSVKRQSGITAPVGRFYSVCRLTAART